MGVDDLITIGDKEYKVLDIVEEDGKAIVYLKTTALPKEQEPLFDPTVAPQLDLFS